MKRFLFILSGNISTTPRAQKAVESAIERGIEVELWMVNRMDKWKRLDKMILEIYGCEYHYLSILRKEGFLNWLFASVLEKLSSMCLRIFPGSLTLSSLSSSKVNCLYYLKSKKRLDRKYDLVLGYSSAYFPAQLFSKKTGAPFCFDMEDYHPWEKGYNCDKDSHRTKIEKQLIEILPECVYVSFASPLIERQTTLLFRKYEATLPKSFVVNNTFSSTEFDLQESDEAKIGFVWFSQTVSFGRGLEQILPVLEKHKDKTALTIIGNLDNEFKRHVLERSSADISLKEAMPQKELHHEIGRYDIGLALEIPQDACDNRSICLTNKIFAYFLSGLWILATDTPAQREFIDRHRGHGALSALDPVSLTAQIEYIIENASDIRSQKAQRFHAAKHACWENEKNLLLDAWSNVR